MRWFWRVYAAVAVIAMTALWFGPLIEGAVAPIRGPQSIRILERTEARLCWAWTFVKRRPLWSDNEDAFLEINGEPSGVLAPYSLETGYPWGMKRFSVAPRSEPYTLDYCVALPPAVKPYDAIRIHQAASYPGFLGLWRLSVAFPDIVSTPQD